jgi:hypothetical protein
LTEGGKAFLNELHGYVYEGVRDGLISDRFKNRELSGDVRAGSVTVTRPALSVAKPYGTARTAQKGDSIRLHEDVVQVTTRREIVEEVEENDLRMSAVSEVLIRRSAHHIRAMTEELESAFYAEAVSTGTVYTPNEAVATIGQAIDGLVLQLSTLKNDFVRGVPRNMIHVIVAPQVYNAIRTFIDAHSNPNVNTVPYPFGSYHGVPIYESSYMPDGIGAIALVIGAIAQPIHSDSYTAERIQLSNATGVSMFYTYGTKAIAPDLIYTLELEAIPGFTPPPPTSTEA